MYNVINMENLDKPFSSPKEELEFLRERIAKIEKQFESNTQTPETQQEIKKEKFRSEIIDYGKMSPEQVLPKGVVIPERVRDEIVLELRPESHDEKMAELIGIAMEKGVINAIDIAKKIEDDHVNDDFHRFLIEYIRAGYQLNDLKESLPIFNELNRNLFSITIPERQDANEKDTEKSLVAQMQVFFSGMLSIVGSKNDNEYMSVEIANPIGSREFVFYISIHNKYSSLLEKQVLSVFPDAIIELEKDDFNIFPENGYATGVYALLKNAPAQPIKTIDDFETDPLDVILSTLTKIDEKTEGATIQLIFKPVQDFYNKNYVKGLKKLEDGKKSVEEFHIKNTTGSIFLKNITNAMQKVTEPKKDELKENKIDSDKIAQVKKKIESPIVSTNIRIIASASTLSRSDDILREIKSSFNQFEDPISNRFTFHEIDTRHKKDFFHDFIYRKFSSSHETPLNLKEIATIFHLPERGVSKNPQLRKSRFSSAAAPLALPKEGLYLGENVHSGMKTDIFMTPEDRLRHFYVIGQTGTGKTSFLKQMIVQDIQNGDGVCFIDPHGTDIQDILANIPKERYEDVIYFDPANTSRPMALNMLEYDRNYPEQKTFVVNEMLSIFNKLFDMGTAGGPMFEQYFRNATLLVIEDPDTGSTLLDVSRVLSDKMYRELKLSRCKNPVVVQFWREIADKAGGEASLQNIVPYITSKFDTFLANDIMRPVIAQEKSSFDFRKVMDEKKILLVNLSKGRLGDINSHLIGLILVGKILMAALSRVDSNIKEQNPFYLYIDEFQNVTTDSISTILSEARKYKLGLNLAHQFIAQLDEKIKNAVFGNVGTMAVFRVGNEDSQYLENQFLPSFSANDIMNIENLNCYLKMLAKGTPQKPFNIKIRFAPPGNPDIVEDLKQLSFMKYGQDKEKVDRFINAKYLKPEL
jgi:hypothetical protein